MVAQRGRPASETPKDYMLRVRMDEETVRKLDECCENLNLSRSEVVRKGIEEQHAAIAKEK
jgi:predicted transcriptional regulator